jgi:hypothetical protein
MLFAEKYFVDNVFIRTYNFKREENFKKKEGI